MFPGVLKAEHVKKNAVDRLKNEFFYQLLPTLNISYISLVRNFSENLLILQSLWLPKTWL